MAGIVFDMEAVRAFIETACRAIPLKTPTNADDGEYTYRLVAPRCFFDSYPDLGVPEANLPSVLLRLDSVDYTDGATTYGLRLVFGVWDSGTHREDNFKRAADGVSFERDADADAYVKRQSAVVDLLNFVDVVTRSIRTATSIGGLRLVDDSVHVEVADEDDVGLAGFRFASVALELTEAIPVSAAKTSIASADVDGDGAAEDFTVLL